MTIETRTSPLGGVLSELLFTEVGGIIVDMIGLSGTRLTAQIDRGTLPSGFAQGNPFDISDVPALTAIDIAALGGGLSAFAVRVSLRDGDSAAGEFDVNQNFLSIGGTEIGNFTDVPTIETDQAGTINIRTTNGFPNGDFATGWFNVSDAASLASIFTDLETGSATIGITLRDIDPGDNLYDFNDGVSGSTAGYIVDAATPPITGTTGDDTFTGTADSEFFIMLDGDDEVFALDGDDTVFGGDGDDRLLGGLGNDQLNGDAGNDFLSGADGIDIIDGGNGNDRIVAGSGDDTVSGGSGNDVIDGDAGNDTLDGGSGRDDIDGGDGGDRITGGDGFDLINGGAGDDSINGGADRDLISGGVGDDIVIGGSGDDRLDGDEGDDLLDGGPGDDLMRGGDGNDVLIGSSGLDRLFGGFGNDTLDGGSSDDRLFGGFGVDVLTGGSGDDLLRGDQSADTLTGGTGDDRLFGGAQADTFIFDVGMENDTLVSFEDDIDSLQISSALAAGQTAQQIADGATLLTANVAVIDFGGGDTLRLVDTGGITLADFVDDIVIL